MEVDLQNMVETWWREKVAPSGGVISSKDASTYVTEIAGIIEQSEAECLEVARNAGLISDEPVQRHEDPREDSQPKPEQEGDRVMVVKHLDVDLTTVNFVMKYWVECGNGRPKLLLDKALSIGRKGATIAGINSAKQVLRKQGWTPGETTEPPAQAPVSTSTGAKRGPKKSKNPLQAKIDEIQEQIAEHENQIVTLKRKVAIIQEVLDMAIV